MASRIVWVQSFYPPVKLFFPSLWHRVLTLQESPQQAEEEAGTPHHEVLPDNEMEINESIYGSRNWNITLTRVSVCPIEVTKRLQKAQKSIGDNSWYLRGMQDDATKERRISKNLGLFHLKNATVKPQIRTFGPRNYHSDNLGASDNAYQWPVF